MVDTELQPTFKTSFTDVCKTLYPTCISNHLSEDEPSGSKNVEDFFPMVTPCINSHKYFIIQLMHLIYKLYNC